MHLNVGKRRLVQHSLLNDVTVKDFDAIAVVEPYIFQHPRTGAPYSSQQEGGQMGMHDTHSEQPSGSTGGAQLSLSQQIATTSQRSSCSFREGVLL
jgi:hypothetical protein